MVEGWEDTYQSWLHDAAIKVKVNDDVENALESGAQLLARWADAKDSKLSAADKKVLRDAAKTMENKSLSAEERLAAVQSSDIEQLHETNPVARRPVRVESAAFPCGTPEVQLRLLVSVLPTFRRSLLR